MKKLALLLTFVLLLGVLAACGPAETGSGNTDEGDKEGDKKSGETTTKPEKLVVWEDKDRGVALEPAIASFEEEYGIEVEYKEFPMIDIKKQLRLDGPAGKGPDVLTLPHDQIGALAVQGLLEPMEVDQSVVEKFTESSIQALTYKGQLYGLPKAVETPIFIYNKKYMDKAPETFEELWAFSKDFTKEGKYGFLALWDNFYFSHAVTGGYGGYVFKNDGGQLDPNDLGINSEGAIEGANYIQKWYESGLFPKGIIGKSGGSTMNGLFSNGKVASKMDGPWAFQAIEDAGIEYGVSPLPKLPNGEYPETFIGVKGWHVSAYSEHKEWSKKLVKWITNKENSKIRYEKTGEIPPIKSLVEDPLIQENEASKAIFVQAKRGVPTPSIPAMGQVWEPMATALQLIATGKQEPEKALNEAAENIQAKIDAMK
ncbi:extracellular solute-binding protein [Halobacillus amylolyticus]|uniref:Extracellular solute-binding protein n=1 Tax=Halobacillus amylolyticus TaxID=2932259 RepID=A0ABY4H801_9BACI|nr:extracellular solute-binding protein [Halobacillus amylolyticus]UOR11006.1 extracellular solute-binding protein [Halobacillus amylolyticus]